MPLAAGADWFLTKHRSPAIREMPSTVCVPESVIFAVVAALQGAFHLMPAAAALAVAALTAAAD